MEYAGEGGDRIFCPCAYLEWDGSMGIKQLRCLRTLGNVGERTMRRLRSQRIHFSIRWQMHNSPEDLVQPYRCRLVASFIRAPLRRCELCDRRPALGSCSPFASVLGFLLRSSIASSACSKVCKVFEITRERSFRAERKALIAAAQPNPHPSIPCLVEDSVNPLLIVTKPIVKPMSGRSGD